MIHYPSLDEWFAFCEIIQQKSFRAFAHGETSTGMLGFRLIRPESRRYQEPGEICFVFQMPPERGNDYRVIVMTTKRRRGWVSHDSGFVIIVDAKGRRVHTSRPIIRNKPGFLSRLLEQAQRARWRVVHRPLHCENLMHAAHRHRTKEQMKKNLYWKASFWRCAVHPKDKKHVRRWNDLKKPFPPDVEARMQEEWRKHTEDNRKLREAGGQPYAAFRKRMEHPWIKEPVEAELEY